MSKKDDALKKALENICAAKLCEFNSMSSRHEMIRLMDAAITAIREALAEQPAQQEPVAEYIGECNDGSLVQLYDDVKKGAKFYISPPQRKPLTDEQIERLWYEFHDREFGWARRFARAIEAAHGIKENT